MLFFPRLFVDQFCKVHWKFTLCKVHLGTIFCTFSAPTLFLPACQNTSLETVRFIILSFYGVRPITHSPQPLLHCPFKQYIVQCTKLHQVGNTICFLISSVSQFVSSLCHRLLSAETVLHTVWIYFIAVRLT